MAKPNNIPLTNDEHSLIFAQNFNIHFRPKGANSAPINDYASILTCAVQVTFAFLLSMVAHIVPFPWSALCWICVGLILFFRFLTLVVFASAVIAGRYFRGFYFGSAMFWGWWPMWLALCCVSATVAGSIAGTYIWSTCLSPYYELKTLQMYKDVNPAKVSGVRIQDAGLVDFTSFVGTDRSKGGCFMNRGDTYCIAPIVFGGQMSYGLSNMPQTGSFDYFAVGINCCSCPNRDFQCGDWRNPLANGGIRSLDYASRPFYNLALEDWEGSYGKTAKNPMFFDWVQDPEWVWKGMWNRFLHLFWISLAFAVSVGLSLGFFGDKLLQALWHYDIVAPRVCFAPAPGQEFLTMMLLPKMFFRFQQEQTEIAAMPISVDWREQRGPGSAQDDKRVQQEYGYGGTGFMVGITGAAMSQAMAPPGASPGFGGAMSPMGVNYY